MHKVPGWMSVTETLTLLSTQESALLFPGRWRLSVTRFAMQPLVLPVTLWQVQYFIPFTERKWELGTETESAESRSVTRACFPPLHPTNICESLPWTTCSEEWVSELKGDSVLKKKWDGKMQGWGRWDLSTRRSKLKPVSILNALCSWGESHMRGFEQRAQGITQAGKIERVGMGF